MRRALVLGGTGMLAGCVGALVDDGWHVVLPSRRYAPIPVSDKADPNGRVLWVAADWSDPETLATRAKKALGGRADLLVAWVYSEARPAVLDTIAPLLAEGAPVVEVHGSASADPVGGCPEPVLADHPTQQVVLGFVHHGGRARWLTHDEIAEGVLSAVRRALDGRQPAVHQVGEPRPWSTHQ
ncbi:hypothetical protein EV193_108275 [Herbihabitans rhizosphaerae]|uniref:Short subunit dehydrogenase n=1 Tax=Herbihabitans rhizosphaerae TaxID=1872711 RepID=A0A4Q7KKV1_9PSEU|nr:hypothetical protein [Herbihabitans rhizosphaerae]RZS34925.1 hypothetical protein EV193_108275 [Herbihabitans rhizosphaerae]